MKPDISTAARGFKRQQQRLANTNKSNRPPVRRISIEKACAFVLRTSLVGMVLWTCYSHQILQQAQNHDLHGNFVTNNKVSLRQQPVGRRTTTTSASEPVKEEPVLILKNDFPQTDIPLKITRKSLNDEDTESDATQSEIDPRATPASKKTVHSVTIPIFYTLYVKNDDYLSRVRDAIESQLQMTTSGLHGPVFVNSFGSPLKLDAINSDTTLITNHHIGDPTEIISLQSLWEHCQDPNNHESSVVYLHSKWSHESSIRNKRLRQFLTAGALSRECATMPADTCNVCSTRFLPIPHPHASGNMWLARCSYVKQLIAPNEFIDKMEEYSIVSGTRYDQCDGSGRFAAQHWIHSHPTVKPCDLYTDKKFTWNYDQAPKIDEYLGRIELRPAPRFKLEQFTPPLICPGRGSNIPDRLKEYRSLYNQDPPDTWWGYNFLENNTLLPPYYQFGWKFLTERMQSQLLGIGYNERMWDNLKHRIRPFELYGKHWEDIPDVSRSILETFGYTKLIWEKDIKRDSRYREEIIDIIANKVPIENAFGRCNLTGGDMIVWQDRSRNNHPRSTWREYVYEADHTEQRHEKRKRLLIISAVPRDRTHILSLWSELECFTSTVNHIIISSPDWGQPFIEKVIEKAKKHIPHFINGQVTIEVRFFLNNRYDVGLWCDALESANLGGQYNEYEEYGLINDSVYALRPFSALFDNIGHMNVHMTSMSYSLTGKGMRGYGKQHYWVESIFRGFDKKGLDIFMKHSCVPEDHPSFCPESEDQKPCIINNFEHDLTLKYPCDKVHGIYPSDLPKTLGTKNDVTRSTWIKSLRYWRLLVEQMGFPIAKVNEPEHVGSPNDFLLRNCTKHYPPPSEMFEGMNFDLAKPYYQQDWDDLDPNLRLVVAEALGLEKQTWNRGVYSSEEFSEKGWDHLSDTQRDALNSLGCSKLMFNRNKCHRVNESESDLE